MKKEHFLPLLFFLSCVLTDSTAQAPVAPAQWNTFVHSVANPLLRDTFRLQNFEGTAADNWPYTVSGGAQVFNASRNDSKQQCGNNSLKIPVGGKVDFAPLEATGYDSVVVKVLHAGFSVSRTAVLSAALRYRNGTSETKRLPVLPDPVFPCSFDYGTCIGKANTFVNFSGNPEHLSFSVPDSAQAAGFYGIDYVFAEGSVPTYSLFSGAGPWDDTARWTHLPPARLRRALVTGTVSVTGSTACREVSIGEGTLRIAPSGSLDIQGNLVFYSVGATATDLVNQGDLHVEKRVGVRKTFPEKGVWYFISFPFDVYASGISGATLKDGEPNNGGDYFYVKRYDAQRRAATASATGNWVTVGSGLSSSKPVFEKNKGYLVALDPAASTDRIVFSSASGAVAASFGKTASVAVPFYACNAEAASLHSGWFLCGNPFPAPLPVSALAGIPGVGEYLYYYDGVTYQVYETGSDGVIPPFGAFFLKTEQACSLQLDYTPPQAGSSVQPDAAPGFEVRLTDGRYTDNVRFSFAPASGEPPLTRSHAYKWMSLRKEVPQVAACSPDGRERWAVKRLGKDLVAVPLVLSLGRAGRYTLSGGSVRDVAGLCDVWLVDRLLSDTVSLVSRRAYTFPAPAGEEAGRFALLFRMVEAGAEQQPPLACYTENDRLYMRGLPRRTCVCLVAGNGRVRQRLWLPAGDSCSVLSAEDGAYRLRVDTGGEEREFPVLLKKNR
ncbi:MAG: hypothetical protein LIP00_11905 [Parabacteroides sp.]|nr:hypothetical protein [Parabacteroides sp.]